MPLYIAKSGDLDRCYRCLTVDPNIEDEIDFPSKNADRLMPILHMKMSTNQQNEVVYMEAPMQQVHHDGKVSTAGQSQKVNNDK